MGVARVSRIMTRPKSLLQGHYSHTRHKVSLTCSFSFFLSIIRLHDMHNGLNTHENITDLILTPYHTKNCIFVQI